MPANITAPVVTETRTIDGIFHPIDMSTASGPIVWNTAKGGSTIPIKFRVSDENGDQVTGTTDVRVRWAPVKCDASGMEDAVEVTSTGGTTLRHDGNQYVQNWKTPTKAGCYVVIVEALGSDGETVLATKVAYIKIK